MNTKITTKNTKLVDGMYEHIPHGGSGWGLLMELPGDE